MVAAKAVIGSGGGKMMSEKPTDRPTNQLTDGWMDRPSYRDTRTHLKMGEIKCFLLAINERKY